MTAAPNLSGIHHVAYRCRDAKETTEFYQRVMGMDFDIAFAENEVPSTGEHDPYMHIFPQCRWWQYSRLFRAARTAGYGQGSQYPGMGPAYRVQRSTTLDELLAAKANAEAEGLEVLGPTHHGIFKSIYFFDPNGHRLEIACDIGTDEEMAALRRVAPEMLEEWSRTKKAPQHAAWLARKGPRRALISLLMLLRSWQESISRSMNCSALSNATGRGCIPRPVRG